MAFGLDIGGLISGIASASAAAQAAQIEYENLQFQKEQAKKQYDLATSTRTDAYGNKQRYDPILKQWVIDLTPTQEGLVRAGEHEQNLSLTEDAGRNRDTRRRQATRAAEAVPDYNRALMGYRYDQPKSEGGQFGELATLIASGNERNVREAQTGLGRQALRLGRGSDIPGIVKASNDYLGEHVPDYLLQARQEARAEHGQDVASHNAEYLPALEHFAGVEDSVGTAPQMFSNAPGQKAQEQQAIMSAIASAIAQGSAGVGSAYGGLASAIARTGAQGLGGALTASFGGGGGQAQPGYMTVPPGNSIFDPSTGQVLYTAPVYGKSGVSSSGGMIDDGTLSAINRLNDAASALY